MEPNQLLTLSPSELRRAAELKERIDELTNELGGILNGRAVSPATGKAGGRRKMSPEARAKIAAAARARWARYHAEKGTAPSASKATGKRRAMSAAGKRRIAEAAKARWAKYRAEKGEG